MPHLVVGRVDLQVTPVGPLCFVRLRAARGAYKDYRRPPSADLLPPTWSVGRRRLFAFPPFADLAGGTASPSRSLRPLPWAVGRRRRSGGLANRRDADERPEPCALGRVVSDTVSTTHHHRSALHEVRGRRGCGPTARGRPRGAMTGHKGGLRAHFAGPMRPGATAACQLSPRTSVPVVGPGRASS